jgi:formate hydrogenlyase subunit 4
MDLQSIINTVMIVILGSVGLTIFGIIFGLFSKGVDRKISAHMQGRVGPPLIQPFRDVRKLFTKENIVPDNAVPWVFHLAPVVGLVGAISILLYLPIIPQSTGGLAPLIPFGGDMILILYLLIIPSLALVIGGFASGSPYATIGAQREMATMIAYEFPLAIIIVTLAWKLGSTTSGGLGLQGAFAISTITTNPVWNISGPLAFIGFIILLIVLVIVTPAELSKIPFDAPEAETEIGGGLLVEYSGRNLGMFYLMDSVKTVVMAGIIVALFFPYNLSPLLGLNSYPGAIIDFIFFLVKVLIIVVVSVSLIRVAVARLKIDQIVYTYWVPLTLLALVGLIFIMWEGWTFSPETLGWKPLIEMLGLI